MFTIDVLKHRVHSPIVWSKPIASYLEARNKLKGCKHITVRIVRSNRTKNTGAFVFQIDGFEIKEDFR